MRRFSDTRRSSVGPTGRVAATDAWLGDRQSLSDGRAAVLPTPAPTAPTATVKTAHSVPPDISESPPPGVVVAPAGRCLGESCCVSESRWGCDGELWSPALPPFPATRPLGESTPPRGSGAYLRPSGRPTSRRVHPPRGSLSLLPVQHNGPDAVAPRPLSPPPVATWT